jgi:hypothetical protein
VAALVPTGTPCIRYAKVIAAEHALVCHPDHRSDKVRRVLAGLGRMPDGHLALAYVIEGELARLRIPAARKPGIGERLWQHTCCEIFIAREGRAGYHEFNFAPSREWAAYAFRRYREGTPLIDEALDPQISTRNTGDRFELNALISLQHLFPHGQAKLLLALSVVVEDDRGALSYWALRHPPGKPDFHHPEAFALALDELRN